MCFYMNAYRNTESHRAKAMRNIRRKINIYDSIGICPIPNNTISLILISVLFVPRGFVMITWVHCDIEQKLPPTKQTRNKI